MERFGFVYLWRDRKYNRFYLGCHWGTEDDGYICSSTWMRNSYRRRPQDFKRRILSKIYDRKELLKEEYNWLQMIKEEELGQKYYNINKHHYGHWSTQKSLCKSTVEKMRESLLEKNAAMTSEERKEKFGKHNLGRKFSEETIAKKRKQIPWNKGKTNIYSEETLKKMSESSKGQIAWNKDKTNIYSEETKEKMAWNKGKNLGPRSENVKKKIGEKNKINTKRCWQDPKHREKMSKAAKGRKWYKCHETGKRIFYRIEFNYAKT